MVNDPVADFLTRLRNAIERKKETVEVPNTKMIHSIAKILKEEGFVVDFEVTEAKPQDILVIYPKYVNGSSAIRELVRVSKPGIRKYRGYKEIEPIMNGMGVGIFSTPMGVIKSEDAIKNKVGGEYICYVF